MMVQYEIRPPGKPVCTSPCPVNSPKDGYTEPFPHTCDRLFDHSDDFADSPDKHYCETCDAVWTWERSDA